MQRLIQAKSEEARLRQQLDAEREKARQEQDMHRHALAQLREQQNVRAQLMCLREACCVTALVARACPACSLERSTGALRRKGPALSLVETLIADG